MIGGSDLKLVGPLVAAQRKQILGGLDYKWKTQATPYRMNDVGCSVQIAH